MVPVTMPMSASLPSKQRHVHTKNRPHFKRLCQHSYRCATEATSSLLIHECILRAVYSVC
jgi:hypothetical protein